MMVKRLAVGFESEGPVGKRKKKAGKKRKVKSLAREQGTEVAGPLAPEQAEQIMDEEDVEASGVELNWDGKIRRLSKCNALLRPPAEVDKQRSLKSRKKLMHEDDRNLPLETVPELEESSRKRQITEGEMDSVRDESSEFSERSSGI